jgi:hypothetical protein
MVSAMSELERISVEAVGNCFKLLSRHSPRTAMKITVRRVGILIEIRTGCTHLPNTVQVKHVIS